MIFRSQKNHCFDLLSKIYKMLNDSSLCDVSISIEGTVFWAHRCILIAACPTLFDIIVKESENSQKKTVQLTLQGLSVSGFNALLLYVYTGQPPDVNDESLMTDFVKSCCALGVSLPVTKKNKDFHDKLKQIQKDTEIVVEVTDVSYNKHNESDITAESEGIDNDHDVSPHDIIVDGIVDELNSADEFDKDLRDEIAMPEKEKTEVQPQQNVMHQKEPGREDFNLQSLYSVNRRIGKTDVTSEASTLLPKYPRTQNHERSLVENNSISPVGPALFSVKRRIGKTGVTSESSPLLSKYTKIQNRKRSVVENDSLSSPREPVVHCRCPFAGCGKMFETIPKMKKHRYIHGKKKHICTVCEKKFLNKKDLINHRRIHTGEKPYECAECGMKFTNKGTLKSHLETHINDGPKFACNLCDKAYKLFRNLSVHMKKEHDGKKPLHIRRDRKKPNESRTENKCYFCCEKCGKKYRRKEPYELHIENCSVSLKNHHCHLCDAVFKHKRLLTNHIFTFHSTPKYRTETGNIPAPLIQVCIDSNEA